MPPKLPLKLKSKERETRKRHSLPNKKLSDKPKLRLRLKSMLNSLKQLLSLKKRPKRRCSLLKERRNSDSSRKRPSLKSNSRKLKPLNWRQLDKRNKLKVLRRSDAPRRELMPSVPRSLLPKQRRPDSTTREETLLLPSKERS